MLICTLFFVTFQQCTYKDKGRKKKEEKKGFVACMPAHSSQSVYLVRAMAPNQLHTAGEKKKQVSCSHRLSFRQAQKQRCLEPFFCVCMPAAGSRGGASGMASLSTPSYSSRCPPPQPAAAHNIPGDAILTLRGNEEGEVGTAGEIV